MNPSTLFAKPAETHHEIHDLLKHRWSPRAFAATPVSKQDLHRLFEAARWSPSANNIQPWAFVVATQDNPEHFAKVAGLLNERNTRWATQSPVLVIALLNKNTPAGTPNAWAAYDLGQAVAHLSIQAQALGISLHQMAGFNSAGANEVLGIPESTVRGRLMRARQMLKEKIRAVMERNQQRGVGK